MSKYILYFIIFISVVYWTYADEGVTDGFILVSTSTEKTKQWKVEGSTAKFLEDNWVEIMDVKVMFFDEKERKYYAQTPKAMVHRGSNEMKTEERIHIWRKGLKIDAIGLHFNPDKKKMIFKKDVFIETYSKKSEDLL